MTHEIELRYQKNDKFNYPVFIANAKKETDAYTKLKRMHKKLTSMDLKTYLPVYSTSKYATMRLNKKNHQEFQEQATYKLVFTIKKSVSDDERTFANIYLVSSELKASAPSLGEDIVF